MPKSKSPTQIIASNLAQSARTARLARSIIDQRLIEIQSDLQQPKLPPHEKAQLLLQAVEILKVLGDSMDKSARSLMKPQVVAPEAAKDPAADIESIMSDLVNGKRRKP